MIPTIQAFPICNTSVTIDLTKVPTISPISEKMAEIFEKHEIYPLSMTTALESYKNRIDLINNTAEKLKTAKDNAIKDKLIALLKTTLVIAGMALFITSFSLITMGAPFIPCILGVMAGILIYDLMSIKSVLDVFKEKIECSHAANLEDKKMSIISNEFHQELNKEKHNWLLFAAPVIGFIAPIYQAFTRISRLEKTVELQKQNFLMNKEKDSKSLEYTVKWYHTYGETFVKVTEDEIQNVDKKIEMTPQNEELIQCKAYLEKQKAEFLNVTEFSKKIAAEYPEILANADKNPK